MRHATGAFTEAVLFAAALGGVNGFVDRQDDVGDRDIGGFARQRVTAARTTG